MHTTEPVIKTITAKKLMGRRMAMSFAGDKTAELWRNFMPHRKEITNTMGTDLYAMQVYAPHFFRDFDANKSFEKWAAVEVSDFSAMPDGMETFRLPPGAYAVFAYKGDGSDAPAVFQYILGTWLPASAWVLDSRPHFELLGDGYKKGDPGSEEEIWIPVKKKQ